MMLHNFTASLQHEREQTLKADAFYRETLKVSELIRFNSDSKADLEMQRQDVDLLLTLNNITYRVSEKFRDVDYGDLYIEVYSKFPKTMGWLHTGSPNAILYFMPELVYWITHKSLHSFCTEVLFPSFPENWFLMLYQSQKTIVSKRISINGKTIKINLIQARNQDGARWSTLGISIPFWVLEENGVKFKKYPLSLPSHLQT